MCMLCHLPEHLDHLQPLATRLDAATVQPHGATMELMGVEGPTSRPENDPLVPALRAVHEDQGTRIIDGHVSPAGSGGRLVAYWDWRLQGRVDTGSDASRSTMTTGGGGWGYKL